MEIVGKQKVDYVSKKSGEPVKGISLHCVGSNNNVEGKSVETVFISARSQEMYDKVCKLPVGAKVAISYNKYRAVENIQVI